MNLNLPRLKTPKHSPPPAAHPPARRWRWWLLLLLVLVGAGYAAFGRMGKARAPSAEASPVHPEPGIPVAAASARLGDFNRNLIALWAR